MQIESPPCEHQLVFKDGDKTTEVCTRLTQRDGGGVAHSAGGGWSCLPAPFQSLREICQDIMQIESPPCEHQLVFKDGDKTTEVCIRLTQQGGGGAVEITQVWNSKGYLIL